MKKTLYSAVLLLFTAFSQMLCAQELPADLPAIPTPDVAGKTYASVLGSLGNAGNVKVGQKGSTTCEIITNVLASTDLYYDKLYFDAIDCSEHEFLHMDVYSATAFTLQTAISGDAKDHKDYNATAAQNTKLTAGTWTSVDIDLTKYVYSSKNSTLKGQPYDKFGTIAEISLSAGSRTSHSMYVTNIYFYKASGGSEPEPEPVEAPTASPAAGTYTSVQSVSLSCATDGADIYYCVNAQDGTYTKYSAAIEVSETQTIYAYSQKNGAKSETVSFAYTINIPTPPTTLTAPPAPTHDAANVLPILGYYGDAKGITMGEYKNITKDDPTTGHTMFSLEGYSAWELRDFYYGKIDISPINVAAFEYVHADIFVYEDQVPSQAIKFTLTDASGKSYQLNVNNKDKKNYYNLQAGWNQIEYLVPAEDKLDCSSVKRMTVAFTNNTEHKTLVLGNIYAYRTTPLAPIQASIKAGAEGLTSFCPVTANVTVPEGVKAYTAKLEGEEVTLTELAEGAIIGMKEGVILFGTEGETYEFRESVYAQTAKDNDLKGQYAETQAVEADGNTYYALGNKEGVGFYPITVGGNIPQGKAYLAVPSASAGVRLKVVIKDDKGTVTAIRTADAKAQSAPMYNLAGQRVGANYKGIVVVNGKKVVRL